MPVIDAIISKHCCDVNCDGLTSSVYKYMSLSFSLYVKVGDIGLSSPFHLERKVALAKGLQAPITVSESERTAIFASLKLMSLSFGRNLYPHTNGFSRGAVLGASLVPTLYDLAFWMNFVMSMILCSLTEIAPSVPIEALMFVFQESVSAVCKANAFFGIAKQKLNARATQTNGEIIFLFMLSIVLFIKYWNCHVKIRGVFILPSLS